MIDGIVLMAQVFDPKRCSQELASQRYRHLNRTRRWNATMTIVAARGALTYVSEAPTTAHGRDTVADCTFPGTDP